MRQLILILGILLLARHCEAQCTSIPANLSGLQFRSATNDRFCGTTAITPKIGAILSACAFAGATADVQTNAAIAALGTNGGTVDARCFGTTTTQTIAATILMGNSQDTLLVDRGTKWNCTITNGTPCLEIEGADSIVGQGESGVGGSTGFQAATSANISAYIEITGAGAGGSVENVGITTPGAATIANGLIWINNTGNILTIRGVQASPNANQVGIKILNAYGPLYFENNYIDCGGIASPCTPVVMSNNGAAGGSHQYTFEGGLYAHPGANGVNPTPIFDVQDAGANVNGVTWVNVALESDHTTDVGYNLSRCAGCTIIGGENTSANAIGKTVVAISNLANGINVLGLKNTGVWTNAITNTAASPNQTLTAQQIDRYSWQGFINTGTTVDTATNGGTVSIDNNGLIATGLAFGGPPVALATFPACAAGTEGWIGRATNCASTTLGTTCSGTGAVHAQVECNGTNWIELGY